MIQYYGGKPADFLDLGGGASVERITAALKIVLADANVKALFINILGGMTRCDDVARGIVEAKISLSSKLPVVVRSATCSSPPGRSTRNASRAARTLSSVRTAQLAVKL